MERRKPRKPPPLPTRGRGGRGIRRGRSRGRRRPRGRGRVGMGIRGRGKTVNLPPPPKVNQTSSSSPSRKKQRPEIIRKIIPRPISNPGTRSSMKKDSLLLEFIQTEDEYVGHLEALKKYIIDGLTRLKRNKERIISDELYDQIFSEFQVILKINLLFVRDLKKIENVEDNLIPFCEVVINFSQCFKLYSTYMGKYFDISSRVREEVKKNSKFRDFLKICEVYFREKQFRITDFQSYLILPIQRIPRYKLLLENLLKELKKIKGTEDYVKEKRKLQQALGNVSQIADYCERKQRQKKLEAKMSELAQIINIQDLIQPHRHLIAEHDNILCSVRNRFEDKRRCAFYIFNDIIVCLVMETRDVRKKSSTIALVLKPGLNVEKVKDKENAKLFGMRVRTSENLEFLLQIFFVKEKNRTNAVEMIHRQIEELKKSTLKLDIQIQKKKKSAMPEIFNSGVSSSSRNKYLEGFEILTE